MNSHPIEIGRSEKDKKKTFCPLFKRNWISAKVCRMPRCRCPFQTIWRALANHRPAPPLPTLTNITMPRPPPPSRGSPTRPSTTCTATRRGRSRSRERPRLRSWPLSCHLMEVKEAGTLCNKMKDLHEVAGRQLDLQHPHSLRRRVVTEPPAGRGRRHRLELMRLWAEVRGQVVHRRQRQQRGFRPGVDSIPPQELIIPRPELRRLKGKRQWLLRLWLPRYPLPLCRQKQGRLKIRRQIAWRFHKSRRQLRQRQQVVLSDRPNRQNILNVFQQTNLATLLRWQIHLATLL